MKHLPLYFLFLLSFNVTSQLNVDFTATPLTSCVGTSIAFTDLTAGSPIVSWAWNFGDGSTSALQNPTHTYTVSGTFNITLIVFNGSTSIAEVKPNYIIVNPLPTVSFLSPLTSCSEPYAPIFSNVLPGSGSYSYSWNFGNGQTSTAQTPTNANYTTTGIFNVTLTVTNILTGCVNSFNQNITVQDFVTNYSVSSNTVCVGEVVNFQDQSSFGANNWSWTFGNGSSSNLQNPTITYPAAGTYTATLTSQNTSNGCFDNFSQVIVVNPLPQPSFTATPLAGCDPLEVDYTNTSAGVGQFNWDFGNGSTFIGANPPNQTYSNTGAYNVLLTLTDTNNCVNSVTLNNYIIVSPLIPNFQADVVEGCTDLAVQFADLSTSPNPIDNPITGWQWDFGNGNIFSGQNPPLQLYPEGVYSVTLTITTDGGCTETLTLTNYISVGIPPVVGFTYTPIIDCAKSDFEFTSTTIIPPGYNPSEVAWAWDFGDGGTSALENPTYNYPVDTGYFDVQLIVSFRGCPDTLIVPNAVYIKAPIALFSPEQTVFCNPTLPLSVAFTDNAILGENSDNVDMTWTWGDGNSDFLVSPALFTNPNQGSMSHTYSSYGTYTIQQLVHNYTTGCSDSITQTISISSIDANFNLSNDSICRNFAVDLTNTSSSSHPISSYTYSMGNGSFLTGADQNYVYNTSGSYTITLQITNSVGCTDSQIFNNFIVLQQPIAQISPSSSAGCVPLDVIFTNNSTISGNGVSLSSFNWTFPDNSAQITNNVSQTTNYNFTSTGSFVTSLIVTDVFGCISSPVITTTSITSPTASYTLDSIVCNLELFTTNNTSLNFSSSEWFIDGTSISNLTNYSGSFNESNPSNATSMSHDIKLIVTDVNGCIDSLETPILVSLPQVSAQYVFSGSNVDGNGNFTCPPVFADLTDLSTSYGNLTQWQWDFGDNNGSTLQNPSNTYVFAGTYTANLLVTDEFGCSDSITYVDYLTIGGPSGNVDWLNIGTACHPEFEFTPSNLFNVSYIIWILGDGQTVNNTESFTHVYGNSGTYNPMATLIDNNNCQIDYMMPSITTNIIPININLLATPITLPIYESMFINQNSTGGTGGIVSWNWTLGSENFTNNTGGGFNYEWQNPGQYTITLTLTDSYGCTEQMSIPVYITAELYIPNVLTANNDGVNDIFMLKQPVFTSYDIIILNRWGNVVSEMYDQKGLYLWDGRNKSGEMCSEGVYFYKLTGTQYDFVEIDKHGFVTLVLE